MAELLLWIIYVIFVLFCYAFVDALGSPAGKGVTSWLSFVLSNCDVVLSHWYPGPGVLLDSIDS